MFANNFSNCLFSIASDILKQENLPFDLIRPLILETAEKIQQSSPESLQTGPAARRDTATIDRHLEYLAKSGQWNAVYQILTDQILEQNR